MTFREMRHHIFSHWSHPKSQSPRKQKHHNLIPHTGQHTSVPSLYLSLSSLKQRNFKDISLYSILLYILESKRVRVTDSLSRNTALNTPSTLLPKPRLTNEKGHQRLWENLYPNISGWVWSYVLVACGPLTGTALLPCCSAQ